jgi:thiol:disulfide interchange protein DsbA
MKNFFVTVLLIIFCHSVNAAKYIEGVHFEQLSYPIATNVESGSVEVVEIFWYGCPHCYELEPYIDKWLESKPKNVVFTRLPAVFNKLWEVHAKAYYALFLMGVLDQANRILFEGMHAQGRLLKNLDSITRFLKQNNIDERKFSSLYISDDVKKLVSEASDLVDAYDIHGVPAIIVDGKYRVTGKMAGSYQGMLDITDYLVQRELSR